MAATAKASFLGVIWLGAAIKRLGGLLVLYLAHVPFLRWLSSAKRHTQLGGYVDLSEQDPVLESGDYEIVRLLDAPVSSAWFDKETNEFVLLGKHLAMHADKLKRSEPYYFRIDSNGQVTGVEESKPDEDAYGPVRNEELGEWVHPFSHPDNGRFEGVLEFDSQEFPNGMLPSGLKLDHFERKRFTWAHVESLPYFPVPIPNVPFDWTGVGYFTLKHGGQDFRFHLPLQYCSRLAYLDGYHDFWLAYHSLDTQGSEVGILLVKESSYSYSPDQGELHRGGYGTYLVRRKK